MEILNGIIDFLINNYQIIIGIIGLSALTVGGTVMYFRLPKDKRIKELKQWLRGAVKIAQDRLDLPTGEAKLKFVYDQAVEMFPWVDDILPFNTFKNFVDEALDWMYKELETEQKDSLK